MTNEFQETITITNIVENADGTATIYFDVPDNVKQSLKRRFKWKRWSDKRFNAFVLEALTNELNKLTLEEKNGNRQP